MKFQKKIGIMIVQLAIFAIAWYYVINKILFYIDSVEWDSISINYHLLVLGLFGITTLMTINWSIEAIKWKISCSDFYSISFSQSILAVLSGTTAAIISPNRAGEPLGKMYFLPPEHRTAGFGSAIMCSISQFTITIMAGVIVFPFYKGFSNPYIDGIWSLVLSGVCFIIIVFLYSKYNSVIHKILKIQFFKRFDIFNKIITIGYNKSLWHLLCLSALRYLVFFIQFFIALKIWGVNISFFNAFTAVALTYFVTTIIPTTTMVELGIRCSSGIFFIGYFDNQPLLITLASMSLWVINISLPALLGSFLYIPSIKNYIGKRT